jgi:hypothetical protein
VSVAFSESNQYFVAVSSNFEKDAGIKRRSETADQSAKPTFASFSPQLVVDPKFVGSFKFFSIVRPQE